MLSGGQELGPLVNAFDICKRIAPTVPLDANLDEASQLMEHDGLDEIPVVERLTRRFLGLVTGRQIAQALNRVSVSLSTLATRDPNIYWATGYRVTRRHGAGQRGGKNGASTRSARAIQRHGAGRSGREQSPTQASRRLRPIVR